MPHINYMKQSAGFTIIELLIVIGIIVFGATFALNSFTQSRGGRTLTTAGQNTLSLFQLAQSRSLDGEQNSEWGIHLDTNQVVLFQGVSFAAATSSTAYPLPSGVEIANISLTGGTSDMFFKKITGNAASTGSFDLRLASNPLNTFSITIDSSGKVYQTGTAESPAGTRVIDLRHKLFMLGWSIKTATILTLRWSDPPNADTVQSVAMASYFDGGKTKFDWSGTVSVGGIPQTLRVHTISLSDVNTSLSIDRDCRTNNKKLLIQIDAKDIATYEADCHTITIGAFGGIMSEL